MMKIHAFEYRYKFFLQQLIPPGLRINAQHFTESPASYALCLKTLLLCLVLLCPIAALLAQVRLNVEGDGQLSGKLTVAERLGIGLSAPKAGLHLKENQSLLIGTDTTGEGTRLLYWAELGAFRVGELLEINETPELEVNNWDRDSVGINSFASGLDAKASGPNSFVGGGFYNTASEYASFVGGGFQNTAAGLASSVSGGLLNTASGPQSFVGGGERNEATGDYSFVGGGERNTASGQNSFIAGGNGNIVSGLHSFMGGGEDNTVPGSWSFVGGGTDNVASERNSFVAGGNANTASGRNSFSGGGIGLRARSYSEAVFGHYNEDYSADNATGVDQDDRLFVIGNGTNSSNRSNALTLLKNGRLGLGTTDPQALLHLSFTGSSNGITIEGDNSGDARLRIYNVGGGNHFIFDDMSQGNTLTLESSSAITFNTSGINERMRIDPAGRVGIGKIPATPGGLLLDVNGDVYANSTLLISDRRFKKHIKAISNPLQRLSEISGWSYTFNTSRFADRNFPEGPQMGLIAQELETVFPELVRTYEDGYKAVNYDGLIPVLVEAVKEQQEKLEAKEARIQELETEMVRLDRQQQEIGELKQLVQELLKREQPEDTGSHYELLLQQEAMLAQNHPNPFDENTQIRYFIPPGVRDARIRITAADGRTIGEQQIAESGPGQLEVAARAYPAGTYYYSLVLDGEVFGTKRMVLTGH